MEVRQETWNLADVRRIEQNSAERLLGWAGSGYQRVSILAAPLEGLSCTLSGLF